MELSRQEVENIAAALAPQVADLLAERLEQRPEWALSVAEAAAWARVEQHVIRDAIDDGRLACVRVGRQVRIRRSDLFVVRRND